MREERETAQENLDEQFCFLVCIHSSFWTRKAF
jgi:hypothetical protein